MTNSTVTAQQTVDYFDTFGNEVTGEVTVYDGETLENLSETVDLTDGDQVLNDVRVTELRVEEYGDDRTVFGFTGRF